jgi:hypothetical protein
VHAVYSAGPIGRYSAADVLGNMRFYTKPQG